MTVVDQAFAAGALLVVAVAIWRLRRIERRLQRMRKDIDELHKLESRLYVMALNANSGAEAPKVEARIGAADPNSGEVVKLRNPSLSMARNPI